MTNQLGVELCPFLELIQENPFILSVRLSDVSGAQYHQLFHLRQHGPGCFFKEVLLIVSSSLGKHDLTWIPGLC